MDIDAAYKQAFGKPAAAVPQPTKKVVTPKVEPTKILGFPIPGTGKPEVTKEQPLSTTEKLDSAYQAAFGPKKSEPAPAKTELDAQYEAAFGAKTTQKPAETMQNTPESKPLGDLLRNGKPFSFSEKTPLPPSEPEKNFFQKISDFVKSIPSGFTPDEKKQMEPLSITPQSRETGTDINVGGKKVTIPKFVDPKTLDQTKQPKLQAPDPELNAKVNELHDMGKKLETLKTTNVAEYNKLVPEFNKKLADYNAGVEVANKKYDTPEWRAWQERKQQDAAVLQAKIDAAKVKPEEYFARAMTFGYGGDAGFDNKAQAVTLSQKGMELAGTIIAYATLSKFIGPAVETAAGVIPGASAGLETLTKLAERMPWKVGYPLSVAKAFGFGATGGFIHRAEDIKERVSNAIKGGETFAAFEAVAYPIISFFRPTFYSLGKTEKIGINKELSRTLGDINPDEVFNTKNELWFRNPNDPTIVLKVTRTDITSIPASQAPGNPKGFPLMSKVEIEAFKNNPSLFQSLTGWLKGEPINIPMDAVKGTIKDIPAEAKVQPNAQEFAKAPQNYPLFRGESGKTPGFNYTPDKGFAETFGKLTDPIVLPKNAKIKIVEPPAALDMGNDYGAKDGKIGKFYQDFFDKGYDAVVHPDPYMTDKLQIVVNPSKAVAKPTGGIVPISSPEIAKLDPILVGKITTNIQGYQTHGGYSGVGKPNVDPYLRDLEKVAETPTAKKITQEKVTEAIDKKEIVLNEKGEIPVYRVGAVSPLNNLTSVTYDKKFAESFDRTGKAPIYQINIKPSQISYFIGSAEKELLIQKKFVAPKLSQTKIVNVKTASIEKTSKLPAQKEAETNPEKGYYWHDLGTGKFIKSINPKPVDLGVGIEAFVQRSPKYAKSWQVVEARSGALLTHHDTVYQTQAAAIEAAKKNIQKFTGDNNNLKTIISDAIKKTGLSPRYSEKTEFVPKKEVVKKGLPTETPGGIPIEYTKKEVKKTLPKKSDFKVGDVLDPQGKTNMEGKVTIRAIEGNTLKFTDEKGTDYSGMARAQVRKLVEAGAWKKVAKEKAEPNGSLAFNPKNLENLDGPHVTKETDKIIKRSEIANELSKKLGVPIRRGHFRNPGALGIFKPGPKVVRIKKGGLPVIFHEVGHFLDDQFGFSDIINTKERVSLMAEYGKSYAGQPGKQRKEAFAEFMRYTMTGQDARAKELAPEFYKKFNATLDGMPEIKEVIETAKSDYARWKEMPATAKILSHISLSGADKGSLSDRLLNTSHNLYTMAMDDLHPISQFSNLAKKQGVTLPEKNDPYVLARNLRGWVGKANTFLTKGTFGKDYWEIKDNKVKPKFTGDSFQDIMKPIDRAGKLNDFRVYIVAQRSLELSARKMLTGITPADAKASIAELEKTNPEFKEVSEKLYKYQDALLNYAAENGLIGPKGLEKIKALNKFRVPFYRVMEAERSQFMGGKKVAGNIGSQVKKIKGSEREIIDPIESIIKDTYAIISAAERNNIGVAMAQLAQKNSELGRLFEMVDRPLAPVKVNVGEVLKGALGVLGEMGDLVPPELSDAMVTIFRPSQANGPNMLTVNFGDRPKVFQVDADLFKALQGLNTEDVGIIMRILSMPAKVLRAGATLTPDFSIRNPVKDQFSAYVFSKYGFKPGIDLVRGLFEVFKKGDVYDLWRMGGGEHSMFVSLDREKLQKNYKELMQSKGAAALNIIKNPIEALRLLSEFGEQATRLGEMRRGLDQLADPVASAYASREVTLDFARIGAKTKAVNSLIAFWNANVQGSDKLFRAFKEKPFRTLVRVLLAITLPSILLYLANRDDKRWKEIPRWQKDLFWIVMTKEHIYRIPKPFGLGQIFGSVPERVLEFMDSKDASIFNELFATIANGSMPGFIPTALIPIIENITNYSFFLNRPIVSRGKESLPAEAQVNTYTSESAKIIGQALHYSPAKVDNLIQGYTGGLGRYAINGVDSIIKGTGIKKVPVAPEASFEDTPVLKAFMIRPPVGLNSESVNKLYNMYTSISAKQTYFTKLVKDGEEEKSTAYLKQNPEIVKSKALNAIIKDFSTINNVRDQLRNSKTLSAKAKADKIAQLDKLQTTAAEIALELLNTNASAEDIEKRVNDAILK